MEEGQTRGRLSSELLHLRSEWNWTGHQMPLITVPYHIGKMTTSVRYIPTHDPQVPPKLLIPVIRKVLLPPVRVTRPLQRPPP